MRWRAALPPTLTPSTALTEQRSERDGFNARGRDASHERHPPTMCHPSWTTPTVEGPDAVAFARCACITTSLMVLDGATLPVPNRTATAGEAQHAKRGAA